MFTSLKQFYRSKEWEETKKRIMFERMTENNEIIDEYSGEPIFKQCEIIFHHKIELTMANVNDYNISLNPENIMIVSFKNHNLIHKRFGYESEKQVYLVYGSPLSGKSTFVRENATKDDLICDIDSIYEMISVNPKYIKNDRLKTNVFQIRNCIYDMIKTRTGKWCNAYVVSGSPLPMDRKRLVDQLGAKEIYIESTREECLHRLYNDESRTMVRKEWEEYINEWFEKYQPDDF